jgi:hypothetical protein
MFIFVAPITSAFHSNIFLLSISSSFLLLIIERYFNINEYYHPDVKTYLDINSIIINIQLSNLAHILAQYLKFIFFNHFRLSLNVISVDREYCHLNFDIKIAIKIFIIIEIINFEI